MDWHAQSSAEVIKKLKTNEKNGLSSAEAKKRLEKYGKNRLHEPKKPSLLAKFIAQFSDFMVLILLIAAVISALAIVCAIIVCLGTKEKHNLIRNSAKQKTTLPQVFSAIFHNDQILWPSLAYLVFSLANTITNGVLFYLYKFVIGKPGEFWVVGLVATIVGFCVSPLFPVLNKYIPRKWLFVAGQTCMICAYLLFIFCRDNVVLMDLGLVLFNINFAQLVTVLTLTDAIEYGQLKSGQRNEAVVLAVRPMIDKFTGAVSNALVPVLALVPVPVLVPAPVRARVPALVPVLVPAPVRALCRDRNRRVWF